MFEVKSVYVRDRGDKVDDGDPFIIKASRKELRTLFDFLRSSDVFLAEGRSSVDFVVNGLWKDIAND